MPVPIGTSAAVPSSRTLNGGLPSWKLKLFQKMSLSVMTLSSGGGNFSESSAFGTIPMRVVVEAALGDRHVAHVRGAEADRAAPAVDVAHDRLDRLVLRRRLPDVERAVVDVVGLGVDDPAADRVERVDAVDAGLRRDQVVHRVAVEVREEEPVGAVVAGLEAVDRDLVGVVDDDAVLLLAAAVEHDLRRLARVADQLQVALLAAVDLDGLLVDAVAGRGSCRRRRPRSRPPGSCGSRSGPSCGRPCASRTGPWAWSRPCRAPWARGRSGRSRPRARAAPPPLRRPTRCAAKCGWSPPRSRARPRTSPSSPCPDG